MAVSTPTKLFQALAATTETTQYIVPASTTVIITQIVISNTYGAAITFGLSVVPSGGTAGTPSRLYPDMSTPPGITILDLSTVMDAGDFISTRAAQASAINVYASGVVVQ